MSINAGTAKSTLDLDYSKFQKGISEAKKLATELGRDMKKAMTDINKGMSNAGKDAQEYAKKINALDKEISQYTNKLDALGNKQQTLNTKIEKSKKVQDEYRKKIEESKREQEQYSREMEKGGQNTEKYAQKVEKAKEKQEKYEKKLEESVKTQNKYEKELEETNKAHQKYAQSLDKATQEQEEYNKAIEEAEESQNGFGEAGEKLGGIIEGLGGKCGIFGNALKLIPPQFALVGAGATAAFAAVKFGFDMGMKANREFVNDLMKLEPAFRLAARASMEFFKSSYETGRDFEAQMTKVGAITNANSREMEALTNTAKEWGSKTKFSAMEIAEAMEYAGMAGWKTSQIIEGMNGIVNLAIVGNTDLARTSDIVTDGLTAMGMSANEAGMFADIMAATITNANTSVELMGETMKYAAPVAGSLGISMQDLSVAIGLMGNAGIKGSQSGTALRAGLVNLLKPTDDMEAAMKKYGISVLETEQGAVDLGGTIDLLRANLGDLDVKTQAATIATIFGKEAMSGWMSVINASESDVQNLSQAIEESTVHNKSFTEGFTTTTGVLYKYEQKLKTMGLSQEEINKRMNEAQTTMRGYEKALDTLGVSEEKRAKHMDELRGKIGELTKIYDENAEAARGLNLSETELTTVIKVLGEDMSVTTEDVTSFLEGVRNLNKSTDDTNKKFRDFAKSNKDMSKFFKDNEMAIDDVRFSTMEYADKIDVLRMATAGLSKDEAQLVLSKMGITNATDGLLEVLTMEENQYKRVKDSVIDTMGASALLAEEMQKNTKTLQDNLESAMEALKINFFDTFAKYLNGMLEDSAGAIEKLLNDPNYSMALAVKDVGMSLIENIHGMMQEANVALQQFPEIMSNMITLACQAVITLLPDFLEAGKSIVLGIADGIVNNKENINRAVNDAVVNIANWILDVLPSVQDAALTLIQSVANAWENNSELITQAVYEFTSTATRIMIEKRQLFFDAGIELALAVARGFYEGIWNAGLEYEGGMYEGMFSSAKIEANDAGKLAGQVFVNEATGEVYQGQPGFAESWKAVLNGVSIAEVQTIAGNQAEVYVNGQKTKISSLSPEMQATIKQMFQDGAQGVQDTGQEAGTKFGDGAKQGIDSKKGDVRNSSDQTFNEALVAATSQLNNLTPETAGALNDVCQAILNSASSMYNGAKTSFSKLGQAAKESMTDMFTSTRQSLKQTEEMIKRSLTDAYKGGAKSLEALAREGKKSMTDLYKGATTSAKQMDTQVRQAMTDIYNKGSKSLQSAAKAGKQSMSDLYNGATTSSGKMKDRVISDWNAIKRALSGKITGRVEIKVDGISAALSAINRVKSAASNMGGRAGGPRAMGFAAMMPEPELEYSYADQVSALVNRSRDSLINMASSVLPKGLESLSGTQVIKLETPKDDNKRKGVESVKVDVNIQNFNNNSETDIDDIMDHITYKIKRELIAEGAI